MVIERLNYFTGEFLEESDFKKEQQYHVDMHRLHNKNMHTWGIADGLDVTFLVGEKKVTIHEGMAIDAEGKQIVLDKAKEIDFSTSIAPNPICITISYKETFDDSRTDTGITGFARIIEDPDIKYPDEPADPSLQLILAEVTLKSDKTIDNIDTSKRKSAGVVAGDLEVNSIAFSLAGTDKSLWPKIEGTNADKLEIDSQKGILINSSETDFSGSLKVDGDLTVMGTTTTINTQELVVEDNIIRVNKYEPPSNTPKNINGGLEVYRGGTVSNAQIIWDEGADSWKIGLEGNLVDVAYGPKWDTLTNNSIANSLHRHSELVSSDGTVDPALSVDNAGKVGIGTITVLSEKLEVNGKVKATAFIGDGSTITALNGSQITTGTVADARIASTITRESRFDPTTGHKHTGGTLDGPIIPHSNLGSILTANTASTDTTGNRHVSDALTKGWQDHVNITSGNPHGTTAALVGALPITGGIVSGDLKVYGGISSAVMTGTGTTYINALNASASSSGSGQVDGLNINTSGTGTGGKFGIISNVSGSGPKYAGEFSATSGDGTDYTNALTANANSTGTGQVQGLYINASGTGTGWKFGIISNVSGSGPKYAGEFSATSGDGTDYTNALTANVNSTGTGQVQGLYINASGAGEVNGLSAFASSTGTGQVNGLSINASGAGTGWKYGISSYASGGGSKRAGEFTASSGDGTDYTNALYANANSTGTGQVQGLYIDAYGTGTGWKFGITSTADGSGSKRAGNFSATSGDGTDYTNALYANANSTGTGGVDGLYVNASGAGGVNGLSVYASGTGTGYVSGLGVSASSSESGGVTGLSAIASGTGTGWKYGILSNAYGNGGKYAGYFSASSGDGSDYTSALYANASSSGSGYVNGQSVYASSTGTGGVNGISISASGTAGVTGLSIGASGTGTGAVYGIYASVDTTKGTGTKYAGYFVGNVYVSGNLSKATGSFLIDHPLDPYNKTLRHSFVESPEDLCLYRGKVQLDPKGRATVKMPEYFPILTKEEEATVTLTSVGKKPILLCYEWNSKFTAFTIFGEPGAEATYIVLADRDDPSIQHLRRPVEEEKGNGHFEKGKLLFPEAYSQPREIEAGPLVEEYRPQGIEPQGIEPQQIIEEHKKIMEEHEQREEEHRKMMEEQRQRMEKLREIEEKRKHNQKGV